MNAVKINNSEVPHISIDAVIKNFGITSREVRSLIRRNKIKYEMQGKKFYFSYDEVVRVFNNGKPVDINLIGD